MLGRRRVLRGVLVGRGVAAGDVPALAADPQMDPLPADAQAVLAAGGQWVHLRVCRECGHVACCDSSPNQHASKHAAATEHPIITSLEPGEDWSWCYVDEVAFVVEPS